MTSSYWLKLYTEILDDPKVGMLSDATYRRFIEFLLVAKENGWDGLLPSVSALAWRLRVPADSIMAALTELEAVGITRLTDAGWLLVNFAKRQGPSPVAERVAQYRKRNEIVTESYEECNDSESPDTEAEAESETELTTREGAPPDPFDRMNAEVSRLIGPFQPNHQNIMAINKMVEVGAEVADLEAAVIYFREEVKKPIRGPNHMLESVLYSVKKRTQAQVKTNGRQSLPTRRTGAIERAKARLANGESI